MSTDTASTSPRLEDLAQSHRILCNIASLLELPFDTEERKLAAQEAKLFVIEIIGQVEAEAKTLMPPGSADHPESKE